VSAWPLLLKGRPAGVLGLAGVAPHAPSAPTGDGHSVLPLLAQLSVLALERVRLQASLQNAARAQDAFLSTAAHELRTPLTSLRGFTQLLLRQLHRTGGVEPRRLTLALQRIEEQTEKLTHLVSRQLDRGRLDAGDLVLDLAVADVVPLLRHVVDTTTAGEGGSQITLRAPQTLLARVDTQRFEQALRGLLTRAVQVSPAGAPVEVVLEPVGDTALRLTVTDHGLPAPEGGAAGLPDPWLNASRQLVELHGGTLHAETVENVERKDDQQGKAGKAGQASKGTRVTVRLPLS
jgi:signal transduction histidine kinase